jgi:hypothetical protein
VQLRFSHSCGSLLWLECLVALISFLWSKLFPSPIDLHSSIWFPRLAGPSSFRVLHDFGICSVSLHCSIRSSFGSAWSLSDRVGSLSDRHLAQPGLCPIGRVSVRSSFGSAWSLSDRAGSLSDRRLAQPGLCPIVPGLCPIVILLSLFLRVVCRWPDSFSDLLFGSSFVVNLSRGLPSTIPGFGCGS